MFGLESSCESESCGSNSMARVPAFQAGCCEFESRLPLIKKLHKKVGLFYMEEGDENSL